MQAFILLGRKNTTLSGFSSMVQCTTEDSQPHHIWKLTHHSVLSIRCWQRGPYQPVDEPLWNRTPKTADLAESWLMSHTSKMRSSCENRATCCDGKVRSTDYTTYWTTESISMWMILSKMEEPFHLN